MKYPKGPIEGDDLITISDTTRLVTAAVLVSIILSANSGSQVGQGDEEWRNVIFSCLLDASVGATMCLGR